MTSVDSGRLQICCHLTILSFLVLNVRKTLVTVQQTQIKQLRDNLREKKLRKQILIIIKIDAIETRSAPDQAD